MKNKTTAFVFASMVLGLMGCTSTTESVNSMGHSHYVANTYHNTANGYKATQSKTYQNTRKPKTPSELEYNVGAY